MASSLAEYDFIADRIKLARQMDRRAVAVVEGHSDAGFLKRIATTWDLAIYVGSTRKIVIGAAEDCAKLNLTRVACIVDRDFDDIVADKEAQNLPIYAYDSADLESMIWHSATLDYLVEELGSREKLHRFGGVATLRKKTDEVLAPLSRLRRENALQGWGLPFDSINLASKIDLHSLSISEQAICDALWSPALGVKKAELYRVAGDESITPRCPRTGLSMIRGRDALAVLGAGLRRLLGGFSAAQVAGDRLEEVARLAANERWIEATDWYRCVKEVLT